MAKKFSLGFIRGGQAPRAPGSATALAGDPLADGDPLAPLISIVTVSLDDAGGLRSTAGSLAEQTYQAFEWLVIDGGSTDGTVALIQALGPAIDHWSSEPDRGVYDAMNRGLRTATGDYLMFLNAGDRLADPEALQAVVEALIGLPGLDLLFGATLLELPSGRRDPPGPARSDPLVALRPAGLSPGDRGPPQQPSERSLRPRPAGLRRLRRHRRPLPSRGPGGAPRSSARGPPLPPRQRVRAGDRDPVRRFPAGPARGSRPGLAAGRSGARAPGGGSSGLPDPGRGDRRGDGQNHRIVLNQAARPSSSSNVVDEGKYNLKWIEDSSRSTSSYAIASPLALASW